MRQSDELRERAYELVKNGAPLADIQIMLSRYFAARQIERLFSGAK